MHYNLEFVESPRLANSNLQGVPESPKLITRELPLSSQFAEPLQQLLVLLLVEMKWEVESFGYVRRCLMVVFLVREQLEVQA